MDFIVFYVSTNNNNYMKIQEYITYAHITYIITYITFRKFTNIFKCFILKYFILCWSWLEVAEKRVSYFLIFAFGAKWKWISEEVWFAARRLQQGWVLPKILQFIIGVNFAWLLMNECKMLMLLLLLAKWNFSRFVINWSNSQSYKRYKDMDTLLAKKGFCKNVWASSISFSVH